MNYWNLLKGLEPAPRSLGEVGAKGVIIIKMKKKDWRQLSQILMGAAIVSVVLAGLGYMGTDIWLASTQWLLVAAVLGLFGLYSRLNS